ncbi:MAG TPA: hypothetical protein VHA74_02330 [Candidatus Dojkabacteria bacterium]|nr:hypothetical protein [Candidatus Dojkabacteria bacterium]
MPINIRRYIASDVDSTSLTSLFRFVSSEPKQKETKGEVICLITLVQAKDFLADKAIKFVWDSIRDTYLMSDSGSIVEDVKKGIAAGRKKIIELVKNDKEIESKGVDLSFCLVVIKGMNAYLGIFGEEELYLFKNRSFVNVGQILNENKASAASMALSDKDVVFMGTKTTVSKYVKDNDGERLAKTFSNYGDQIPSNEAIVALSRDDIFDDLEEEVMEVSEVDHEEMSKSHLVDGNSENEDISHEETKLTEQEQHEKDEREKILEEYAKERKLGEGPQNFKELVLDWFEKCKNFFKEVSQKLHPVVSKISPVFAAIGTFFSNFFGKIVLRFRDFLEDTYGRKLWYRRFMSKVSIFKISNGSNAYGMRVDGYKHGKLRQRRVAIVILLACLVIFVILGVRLSIDAKNSRELHTLAAGVLNSAQDNISQGEQNITFDKTSAQFYLNSATDDLSKLDGKKLNIADGNKYNQLKTKLVDLTDKLYLITPVSESNSKVELFYDTRAQIDSKSTPQDIATFKDEFQDEFIFLTDPGTKAVYRIRLNDKDLSKVADKNGEVDSPQYVDVGVKGIYVYDANAGVIESPFDTNWNNKNFVALTGLDKDSLNIGDVRDLAILTQTDNVYLLSPTNQTVYKATKTGSGYSLPSEYIKSTKFQSAKDLLADLSIYVLSSGANGLNRFTYNYNSSKYVVSKNSIVGLNPALSDGVAAYTGGSLENSMYIFDRLNKRLIVLEKPKETTNDMLHPNEFWLEKQIVYRGERSDAWNDVKDIVVDAQENFAYILDGSRIWKVSLK